MVGEPPDQPTLPPGEILDGLVGGDGALGRPVLVEEGGQVEPGDLPARAPNSPISSKSVTVQGGRTSRVM